MSDLSKFTRKASPAVPTSSRVRGKKETVALTVRLRRSDWERLHQLAVSEGVSIQTLALQGFNRVFADKGLPRIEVMTS